MDDRTPEFGKPHNAEPADGDASAGGGGGGGAGGGVIAGIGCLIAISPIPATYVYCGLRGNPGGCGDMAMMVFGTVPLGGIIMVIGLIVALMSGGREIANPSEDTDSSNQSPASQTIAPKAEFPDYSEQKPEKERRKPKRPVDEKKMITWIANMTRFGLAATVLATIVNLIVLAYWANKLSMNYDESFVNWDAVYVVMTIFPVVFAALAENVGRKFRTRATYREAKTLIPGLRRILIANGLLSIVVGFWLYPDAFMHNVAPFGILNVVAAVTPVTCGITGLFAGYFLIERLESVDVGK